MAKKHTSNAAQDMKTVPLTDRRIAYAIYSLYSVLLVAGLLTWAFPGWMGSISHPGKKSEARSIKDYGDAHMQRRDYPQAIAQYQVALSMQPDMIAARVNLATAYTRVGAFKEALAEYQKALTQNPDLPHVIYYNMALMYERMNYPDQALAYYRKATETEPFPIRTWLVLGRLYYRKMDWDSTIICIQKAFDARLTLRTMYVGTLKRDMYLFENDSTIKPIIQSQLQAGFSEKLYQRYDSVSFEVMMNRDNEMAKAHDMMGYSYLMKKDTAKAIEQYTIALQINPYLGSSYTNLSILKKK
jgi:tetratricopeptide (TPR) repeat protein